MANFGKNQTLPRRFLQFVNFGGNRFGIWIIPNLVGKMVSHVRAIKMVEMLKAAEPVIPTRGGKWRIR